MEHATHLKILLLIKQSDNTTNRVNVIFLFNVVLVIFLQSIVGLNPSSII